MNRLFKGRSIAERGTLCQLKNNFGHKNVSTDVMNSFNHVENFVRFVTEAHVVNLMMHLSNMKEIDDEPVDAKSLADDDRNQYLSALCDRLVSEVWRMPSMSDIQQVLDSECDDDYVCDNWCVCHEGNDRCYNYL